ncbi:ABC transporter substrate-binding protein [Cupriavidus plantarum]|uniref:Amino acid/amide ABC transporter substrate-binding protein (HAAT family) n=2 Tax=Cupriavidus plantarum TaxID=942865 RepID=A0A316EJM9_9BURK|nr:ABC transporter substrate-binding protein [Cupriavidus plantarum]NYH97364.1 branched-chain amino acid transport system substrate-binding protein [Cupriavidus plantarum]PWK29947.1 amino acid/amide ABC transporter substrate-binding protein (HAAT family) [Cupriavidus plantarum]REE92701.1 amino acid/amide ABC transporter substrate-binding protein (HAAT family) [Cupriavidus plantarum]RLK28375.1 amino acid/amide ABC transporter substrate-binding protein (HAAT family) [Cupriavidus plantarum]CAG215
MKMTRLAVAVAATVLGAVSTAASAQVSNDTVKIGFITDLSGLYADIDGQGGLEAIKMAIEDHGGKVLGKPIELLSADHQNKADIAASKAREWMDQQGLDLLVGGTNSGTALAMNKVASEKKRVYINIGAGTARLTNEECSPYTVHYAYDTVALAKGTGSAVVKQGGKSWFFLTADYAFGHSLESDTAAVVKANGGTVAGSVRHPLSASDFSSFLLQAQSSKAQILGLANAGGDTINSIKAAKEFGITKTMKIAGLLMFINDVHSLGLKNTEGLLMTDSWYWDTNDETRKFANRYFGKMKKMPSSLQAADYSSVSNYLKAVEAAKTDDPDKVMAELKKMKLDDFYGKGQIRQDGRYVHDMYLMQVKAPADSKKPWDYLKVVATIPGDQAFTTVAESKCAALKK